ncbi:hypothetical protein GCM10011519_03810 [Marmoricola endophyticus]|uniref:Glycosyltransferase 2-like domain-containing protein n=1 Tax=Marmoricola endophyticus TaxID=2040280 RepID=A0A917BB15_9ACTN|nr:glycosyltransferase family 2 protein [Marmoricola endophyticus]GGF33615.1 hypothetical protein GCM10011519_03810 [Marmoricola endophyticus]
MTSTQQPRLTSLDGGADHVSRSRVEDLDRILAGSLSVGEQQAAVLPVSIVIPTWNEAENIGHVLRAMPAVEQLVIVDADSDDGTADVVRETHPEATILLQKPSGKGNATRAGLEVASAEFVICMDADGSMDPGEIPAFVALLQQGFDMVKGSRGAVGGGSTDFTPLRRAGNRSLVMAYNALFGTRLTDITFGYIGFRRDILPQLGLYATGFEIEVQMVAHSALAGLRFAELPSTEADRISGESHLSTWGDGKRVLATIVKSRFQPGREWWRHRGAVRPVYDVLPTQVEALEAALALAATPEAGAVERRGAAVRLPRQRVAPTDARL